MRRYILFWLLVMLMLVLIPPANDGHAEENWPTLIVSPPPVTIVYFDFDKTSLRPADASILKSLAKRLTAWLIENPEVAVIIEGYADGRSTQEYSIVLGAKMADSVMNYLIVLGVPAGRIKTFSCGKERPVDTRQSEEAWAKNRRVEIRIGPAAPCTPRQPYESYRGCGEYIVAGIVRTSMNGFHIVINEKTNSEHTLKVPIPEEPKLAPYIDRPMKAHLILDKMLDGTMGTVTVINSVQDRIPDPLWPVFDTGFRLIKKMECKE
ncbi:MAG: OmpA family protein [Syntrophus sp. (in: bacteria)]